jgi:hypothetical protein
MRHKINVLHAQRDGNGFPEVFIVLNQNHWETCIDGFIHISKPLVRI